MYSFTYNPDKTLTEQEVSKLAKGMIAILFRDYWATERQQEKIRKYRKLAEDVQMPDNTKVNEP